MKLEIISFIGVDRGGQNVWCWTRETSSSLTVDIGKNSNYPDWEPLKHQSLCNRKDNDKYVLEINSDQLDNGYLRDKER